MTASAAHRVVIVGAGMACHALCQALVARKPRGRFAITVIGEETVAPYNRVRLGEMFAGASAEGLLLASADWYARHNITLHLDQRVAEIDRGHKEVVTHHGLRLAYDTLVLATGSRSWRPDVEGADHARCLVYRDVTDVLSIEAAMRGATRAVVIGGGLLGLEAAKVLRDRGLQVTVIEAAKSLMNRQLDADSADVVRVRVEEMGLRVMTGAVVERIQHAQGVARVQTRDGEICEADLVVIAAGVRARDELAKACALECNVRGGVLVDARLRTSDPDIAAVGECASVRGQTYGLYAPCRAMAEVLADNLSGTPRDVGPLDVSCHLKVAGVEVVALGDYGREHRAVVHAAEGVRRTLLVEQGVLVGAMGVGPWPEQLRVERAVAQRRKVSERELERFSGRGALWSDANVLPVAEWADPMVVCNCARVTAGEIRQHARSGAVDVAVIAERTQATRVCGSCKPLVGALMGDPSSATASTRTWGVLTVSLVALTCALVTFVAHPVAFADSVHAARVAIDRWWRDPTLKQATGFVLAALSLVALVISVRKRTSWLRWGSFSVYRALHAVLGTATLVMLLAHTGLRLGHNLNMMLMVVFLLLNVVGAVTGVMSGLEARIESPLSHAARRWRRPLALTHVVMFWPLPLLLGWHVLSVYYF